MYQLLPLSPPGCSGVQYLADLQFHEYTVLIHPRPSPHIWRGSQALFPANPRLIISYLLNSYICLSRLSSNTTSVVPCLTPPGRIISCILWATQHLVFNLYNYTYHIFPIHSDYALSPSLNCELLKTAVFISYWLLELNLIWNRQFLYDC